MDTFEIQKRYNDLAESNCCLSCGGAINHSAVAKGDICVDLGSGRGTDVLRMAEESGETGFAIGVDVSEKMVEKAKQTAEKMGVKNVAFIQSDLESINLQTNFANLIISNCTLNHVANKQKVWNEIYRILKNGGRFVISDIYSTTPVPDEYRTDPVAVSECWAGSITRDEYFVIMQNAGFKKVEVIEESAPYDKGKIQVCSFTITAQKTARCCCS